MIENYEKYLELITSKIESFFERQKPYIFCKNGCSLCCENGEYPWSEIEYKYLIYGFSKLDNEIKEKIESDIKKLKEEKNLSDKNKPFMHKCPFLIEHSCSVYKYRGIICRSFGLLAQRKGKVPSIPFCSSLGLNYSSVYDMEKKSISSEKFKQTGFEIEPLIFNVSYEFLTDNTFADGFNFKFGEKKPLLDWFD